IRRVPVELAPTLEQRLGVRGRAHEPLAARDDLPRPLALLEELDRTRDLRRLADELAGLAEQLEDPLARLIDRPTGKLLVVASSALDVVGLPASGPPRHVGQTP